MMNTKQTKLKNDRRFRAYNSGDKNVVEFDMLVMLIST